MNWRQSCTICKCSRMFVVLKRQRLHRHPLSCCLSTLNKDTTLSAMLDKKDTSLSGMLGKVDYTVPPIQKNALLRNAKPYIEHALQFVDEAKRSVLIGNTSNAHRVVKDKCSQYGALTDVRCLNNNSTNQKLLVTFETQASAEALMQSSQPCNQNNSFRSRFNRFIVFKPSKPMANRQTSSQSAGREKSHLMALKREISNCQALGECLNAVWTALKPSTLQVRCNYLQCQIIDDIMGDNMADCVTLPHGSALSGLATVSADLDMVMHPLGLSKYGIHRQVKQAADGAAFSMPTSQLRVSPDGVEVLEREFITYLAYSLKHFAMPRCRRIVPLPNARVPIVRFDSTVTSTGCDIGINMRSSNDGVVSSCMLRRVFAHNGLLHPLSHCLRLWARQWKLTSSTPGHFLINFSLTHLLIYYMQSIGECPPISALLSSEPSPEDLSLLEHNPDLTNLGNLYIDFLKFWSKFDYSSVIDIYEGQTLQISDMLDSTEFSKSPLRILNTQNNTKNISYRMSKHYHEMFVEQCARTHQTLTATNSNIQKLFCTAHKL